MIKELLKDLVKFFFFRVLLSLGWLLTIKLSTHFLSAKEYGNYTLVYTAINICVALATGWVSASVLRFYPAYELKNQLDPFTKKVFQISSLTILSIAIILLLLIISLYPYIESYLGCLFQIGILAFVILSFWNILICFLRTRRQVIAYGFFNLWQNLGAFAFGLWLIYFFHLRAAGMIWGIVIGLLILMPVLYYKVVTYKQLKMPEVLVVSTSQLAYKQLYRSFLRYGLPIVLINVFTIGLSGLDKFVIKYFHGSMATGVYAACYAISEQSIFVITSLFSITAVPILFKLWEKGDIEKVKLFLHKITRYYLAIAIPATVGLSILAKPVISLIVEEQYRSGYLILPIVSAGAFLVGVANIYSEALTMHKQTKSLMYCYLIALMVNVVTNFLLVPYFGYFGAAYSTVLTYLVLLLVIIYQARKWLIFSFPFQILIKIICSSAIMGVLMKVLLNFWEADSIINLMTIIALAILTYIILVLTIFKIITPQEKKWLFFKFKLLKR